LLMVQRLNLHFCRSNLYFCCKKSSFSCFNLHFWLHLLKLPFLQLIIMFLVFYPVNPPFLLVKPWFFTGESSSALAEVHGRRGEAAGDDRCL
jgi:hypothetical protein